MTPEMSFQHITVGTTLKLQKLVSIKTLTTVIHGKDECEVICRVLREMSVCVAKAEMRSIRIDVENGRSL